MVIIVHSQLKGKLKMNNELYPELINKLLKYIISIKEKDKEISIIDLILEYSMRNDIDIELIGDAISSDAYFKNILEQDLSLNNYNTVKKDNYDW